MKPTSCAFPRPPVTRLRDPNHGNHFRHFVKRWSLSRTEPRVVRQFHSGAEVTEPEVSNVIP